VSIVPGTGLVLTLSGSSSGGLISSDPEDAAQTGYQLGCGTAVQASVYFSGSGSTIDNWPAFWTSSYNWPSTGEADIAEGLGTLTSNYHDAAGANNSGTVSGTWAGGWHTYTLVREPGESTVYWDGQLIRSYPTADGCAPQYIIFNVGVGWGPTVTGAAGAMKVAYVEAWNAA
jgi:hypothetical protein